MHLIKYTELLFRRMAHWLDERTNKNINENRRCQSWREKWKFKLLNKKKIIYIHYIMPFHLLIIRIHTDTHSEYSQAPICLSYIGAVFSIDVSLKGMQLYFIIELKPEWLTFNFRDNFMREIHIYSVKNQYTAAMRQQQRQQLHQLHKRDSDRVPNMISIEWCVICDAVDITNHQLNIEPLAQCIACICGI